MDGWVAKSGCGTGYNKASVYIQIWIKGDGQGGCGFVGCGCGIVNETSTVTRKGRRGKKEKREETGALPRLH